MVLDALKNRKKMNVCNMRLPRIVLVEFQGRQLEGKRELDDTHLSVYMFWHYLPTDPSVLLHPASPSDGVCHEMTRQIYRRSLPDDRQGLATVWHASTDGL